jgi:hypothetical protein
MIIARSSRLGPALFCLLGPLSSYLGCWLPLWRDRVYPPEFDTRIGFVIGGFAPLTTGCAALAVYGFVRLWRTQRATPSATGTVLLFLLLLPVLASACTGVYLAPVALPMLPLFVSDLLGECFGSGLRVFFFRHPVVTAVGAMLLVAGLVSWRFRRVRQ